MAGVGFTFASSMLWPFAAVGCQDSDGTADTSSLDAGADSSSPLGDGAVPVDAPHSETSTVHPVPGSAECAWQPGARPAAQLPDTHTKQYVIDLDHWQLSNDRGDPVETRRRMNDAIRWATSNGYDKVVVPDGVYLVGETESGNYQAGIELQGNMTLELSPGAVIEMVANDKWNYCVVTVGGNSNVTVRGGTLLGDRKDHKYDANGGGHDEGHGVCVWTGVDRILIEDMELHELTGDGVLIVGAAGSNESAEKPSTNVTIRNNHIHHNRRQGISIVGGQNVVVSGNHIHHIEGTAPQFGIDIEGAGRTDKDILIYRNNFHDNAGGDFVTSSGHNVWLEENVMTQCQVDEEGSYDPALPCDLKSQSDGPVIHWKETDNVIVNNTIRMMKPTANGMWGILGYTGGDGPTRKNPVGNYVAGNTLHNAGIHAVDNKLYFFSGNTLNDGTLLAAWLGCTRLENNHVNRVKGLTYMFRNTAGVAQDNFVNRTEGAPPDKDIPVHFPMADDAPYRNSSPVFW